MIGHGVTSRSSSQLWKVWKLQRVTCGPRIIRDPWSETLSPSMPDGPTRGPQQGRCHLSRQREYIERQIESRTTVVGQGGQTLADPFCWCLEV